MLGKLPPPYYGPAMATQIILNSKLKDNFQLIHLKTNLNESLDTIQKFSISKPFKQFGIIFKLIWFIVRYQPDLVYLTTISQSTTGFLKDSPYILISKLFFRKVLIQLRGSNWKNWLTKSSIFTQWYVKTIVKSCNGVIVLGNNLRYLFEDCFPDDKIYVVPNGANYQFPEVTSKNKKTNILWLSNLIPTKGIEDFLQAMNILSEKELNIQVNIVGAWRNDEFKKKCLNLLQGNPSVTFHGALSGGEKLYQLSAADIFVFVPRAPEGHPWVIVEAMAAGLPIIATNQGAIIESVSDGVNGYIVNPMNSGQVAEKIQYLIDNPDMREKMKRESRRIYEEKFTQDKMAEKLGIAFNKVLENG